MAGVLSWVFTYPQDVIKSRLQADNFGGSQKYRGPLHCLQACGIARQHPVKLFSLQLSLKEEGHGFLLRGIGSTVIRAFPMNAVTFGVFTFIMKKWGYKPEDMEHDTLESLQRKLANGACEVMSIKLDLFFNVL